MLSFFRDTTVQSLTLQTTVKDGVVVYEDSPLVQAVKTGHTLVVDEADKAPTHVTCILKVNVRTFYHLFTGRDKSHFSKNLISVFILLHIFLLSHQVTNLFWFCSSPKALFSAFLFTSL